MEKPIELHNVSIEIPIFDAAKSFRKSLINRLGGEIGHTSEKKICVRALKNISFSLVAGDRVGLIGHNGAGKTTLLRLLANIYKPSRGNYVCRGKITSLFNANLGMDIDDTGLQNIRTMGTFLGMNKREIIQKRDDIIAFSELGDFIHLPVRTYSAGMVTRLSFALATAIEPDILLMDEGIGAGDASFFDKAEKRLNNFYKKIRVLVVASHSDELIQQLCNKAILLEKGAIKAFGEVTQVMKLYRHPEVAVQFSDGVKI